MHRRMLRVTMRPTHAWQPCLLSLISRWMWSMILQLICNEPLIFHNRICDIIIWIIVVVFQTKLCACLESLSNIISLGLILLLPFPSKFKQPLNSGHLATPYNGQFLHSQLYTNSLHQPFQQDCPPSMLELTTTGTNNFVLYSKLRGFWYIFGRCGMCNRAVESTTWLHFQSFPLSAVRWQERLSSTTK